MGALIDIGNLLVQTIFYLYILAVLLRFLLQLSRADFYNPISQALVKLTSPTLNPLRQIIPGIGGIDIAAIILVLLLQSLATVLLLLLAGIGINFNPAFLVIWGALGTIGIIVNIYLVAILVSIIISWVSPGTYNPIVVLLQQLTEPVMKPVRNIIPPMGGLDLSPIFVFLAINVLKIILGHLGAAVGLPGSYVIGA